MTKTLLVEEELQPRIDFPYKITLDTFKLLCKYYVAESGGKRELNLHYEISERIGNPGFGSDELERAQSIDNIALHISNQKIGGQIRKTINSALFSLRDIYDENLGHIYTGLDFEVTPGYKPGELPSDNVELMREFGNATKDFFDVLADRDISLKF